MGDVEFSETAVDEVEENHRHQGTLMICGSFWPIWRLMLLNENTLFPNT